MKNNQYMHIAYSAINTDNASLQQLQSSEAKPQALLRFEAYKTVCEKYSREIAAIQIRLPGWLPPFYESSVISSSMK